MVFEQTPLEYMTIPAIVRKYNISAEIDHKTPEGEAVGAFFQTFYDGSQWSMAILDHSGGLLLMCRPFPGAICIGHCILNIRPGKSGGIAHVEWTAQVIGGILRTSPEQCVGIAESPWIVIRNIDTGVPEVFVWQHEDNQLHKYDI